MNSSRLELATRHGALRAKIDEQRRILTQQSVALEVACERGDAVLHGIDWLKSHPAAVAAAVTFAVVAKPKGAWRWAKRGYFAWRSWQSIKTTIAGKF
jgi:hypothetical protein